MKVQVVVGFSDKQGFTHLKGQTPNFEKAYATELIERGKVVALDDRAKVSKRKSKEKVSKKNAR